MNEFVICAMDKRKTKEELWDNYESAYAVVDDYAAYAAYAAYASDVSTIHAYYSTGSDSTDLEYNLQKYFKLTGEDREAYQKEADK